MPSLHIQGVVRNVIVVDAHQCIPAHSPSLSEAAMGKLLAFCLHAVRNAGEFLGHRVLVTSCEPIGVLVILAGSRAGAAEIIATDIADLILRFAEAAGAILVFNPQRDPGLYTSFRWARAVWTDRLSVRVS